MKPGIIRWLKKTRYTFSKKHTQREREREKKYLQSTVLEGQGFTGLTNTLLTSTESTEVFSGLGDNVRKEL